MKCIDLFGGIGGFRLGAGSTDWKWVWYCDIDKYTTRVYNKNFGESYRPGDITTVASRDIPDHDLICAGFPCQSFSIAGRRRGFDDTRGTLFYEICRIAQDRKTPYLLLENVKGLLSHDGGQTFAIILSTLDEMGYRVQWEVLNSKYFGVPQNRERVLFVANLRDRPIPQIFPLGGASLAPEGKIKRVGNIYPSGGENGQVIDPSGISPTLKSGETDNPSSGGIGSSNAPKILHNIYGGFKVRQVRRLTPLECERLQGFPDGWTECEGISDTQRYKMLGNAVTVNVIRAIVEKWSAKIQGVSSEKVK